MLKETIQKSANVLGFRIERKEFTDNIVDRDDTFMNAYKLCKPFTMTSKERLYALYQAVKYVINSEIEGEFVECGVWKGGSAMMMALTGVHTRYYRDIWLYDTFEGMAGETDDDFLISNGQKYNPDDESSKCYASLEEVKRNMYSTQYIQPCIKYIKGKVENTIPNQMPESISILRLDTDFYESTKHTLIHLYPRLSTGGVLIIDDYGTWYGARKAVFEYFDGKNILLNRIDNTGRIGIKYR